jgi:nucleoside 2-deoxyribosyltransferase
MKKIYDLNLKKVYISGPMSGIPELNHSEFEKAEIKMKSFGFEVFNPHKFEEQKTEEFLNKVKNLNENDNWIQFMKVDIVKMIQECEFVLALNNWERSRGATLELFIAKSLGMPIIHHETYEELNVSFKIERIYG